MDEQDKKIEETIEQAAEKLKLDVRWLRRISPQEILYLLDHCPFLQIKNPDPEAKKSNLQLLQADSGWLIHDTGNSLSSSPGELLFGGGDFKIFLKNEEEEEGGSGSILNAGKGTVRKQAFDTAMQMAEVAKVYGWPAIEIVDGHPIMARAAWMKAEQLGLSIIGFEPSERDIQIRNRVELTPAEIDDLLKNLKMKR